MTEGGPKCKLNNLAKSKNLVKTKKSKRSSKLLAKSKKPSKIEKILLKSKKPF